MEKLSQCGPDLKCYFEKKREEVTLFDEYDVSIDSASVYDESGMLIAQDYAYDIPLESI